jgi:hypothetical protein
MGPHGNRLRAVERIASSRSFTSGHSLSMIEKYTVSRMRPVRSMTTCLRNVPSSVAPIRAIERHRLEPDRRPAQRYRLDSHRVQRHQRQLREFAGRIIHSRPDCPSL